MRAEVAKHHVRVVDEILVQRHLLAAGIGEFRRVLPGFRLLFGLLAANVGIRALLQEDDVRRHLRTGVLGESVVRQADRAQEHRALADVAPRRVALGVQKAAGHNLRHHAAGAQHVHCLGEEVVVQAQAAQVLASALVGLRVAGERRVADSRVEIAISALELREVGALHVLLRVQVPGDGAGKPVALDGREAAGAAHVGRHQPQEVADARAGLQRLAAGEAEAPHGGVHAVHDHFAAGVVRVPGGARSVRVLVVVQQLAQLGVLAAPILVVGVERLRQTTPAHVARKYALLLLRGNPVRVRIQLLRQPDRGDVGLELGFLTPFTERKVVGDGEVCQLRCLDGRRVGCEIRPAGRINAAQLRLGRLAQSSRSSSCCCSIIARRSSRYPAAAGISSPSNGSRPSSSGGNRYISRTISHASCHCTPWSIRVRISSLVCIAASRSDSSSFPAS